MSPSLHFTDEETNGKNICLQCRRPGFADPWLGKIPWRRAWQVPPVFLPGKSHGQRSLVDYSLWVHKESDTTEQLAHTRAAQKEMHSPRGHGGVGDGRTEQLI